MICEVFGLIFGEFRVCCWIFVFVVFGLIDFVFFYWGFFDVSGIFVWMDVCVVVGVEEVGLSLFL